MPRNLVILKDMDIPCAGKHCCGALARFDRILLNRGDTCVALSLCAKCNRLLDVGQHELVLGTEILAEISASELATDETYDPRCLGCGEENCAGQCAVSW